MVNKLMVGAVGLYVLGMLAAAWLLIAAAPGPANQAFYGVGIGRTNQPGGIAYFSGKRLSCADTPGPLIESTCSIEIAGQPLTLTARQGPNGVDGTCSASYAGQPWPCRIDWGWTTNVQWFVYFDQPLGLSLAQMDALRARFPIENLGESPFVTALLVLPVLNALLYVASAWRLSPARLRKNIAYLAAHSGAALAVWLASLILWAWLTNGFWD